MFTNCKYRCALIGLLIITLLVTGCSKEGATPAAEAVVPTQAGFSTTTMPSMTNTPTVIPSATPTETTTPIPPTSTPTILPPATDSAYWPYPRKNLFNTGAYSSGKWQMTEEQHRLWEVEDEEYSFMNLYPVADDLDGDGHAEYVVGRFDPQTLDGFLTVYNVDDGSLLWEMPLHYLTRYCPPVIADLNNDGQLDLVFANQRQDYPDRDVAQIYALNGNDGSVIWQHPFPQGGEGMTVADVNADGWMEIIINDYGRSEQGMNRKLHLLNGRDGSQIWERETTGTQYGQPTATDLDGDGLLEIITHHHWQSVERMTVWDHEGNELWHFDTSPTEAQSANAPPELGRTPCESWESTTVADFNGDGKLEIGLGSRCSYYLLDVRGNVIWNTLLDVEGWGYIVFKNEDGSLFQPQNPHGQGGFYRDSAVGNIDDDPALEIVFAVWPEYTADQFFPSGRFEWKRINSSNAIWALDGADGSVQWVFEGVYGDYPKLEQMWDPLLVDLDGNGQLDVLILSDDNHLYAVNGATGEKMMEYFSYLPPQWEARHLTFVPDGDLGILLFSSHRRGHVYVLNALVITERVLE
jgi:outer membrane protein assembly factor BamB